MTPMILKQLFFRRVKKANAKKIAPTSSEVHVPSIEEDIPDAKLQPQVNNQGGEILKDIGGEAPVNRQQLIDGIDWEMEHGEVDQAVAEDTARDRLSKDPAYYDSMWEKDAAPTDYYQKEKLRLDLGSGQCREPRHIGLDLYPYDKGTVVHDLSMGIPFEKDSASHVRMVNSLQHMEDFKDDPKILMSEISRVLMPGGQFVYEGPNEIYNYPDWMVQTWHESSTDKVGKEGKPWFRQEFEKIAEPDPATANDAEPRTGVAAWDELPADQLLAADALGYTWSDQATSGAGNRLHGYASQGALGDWRQPLPSVAKEDKGAKVFKADKEKQVAYCVVLEPDVMDAQEDVMTAQDIEEAAHKYMEDSREIGSGHTKIIKAVPVESYIAPQDLHFEDGPFGPQIVKKGSWVIGIHVIDKNEWAKCMDGDYTGVSVAGMGVRT